MKPIYADFNARTADDRIRLDSEGSQKSLEGASAGDGDWVWLTDGEVRVGAQLEERASGFLAKVAWESLEYVPDEAPNSKEIEDALRELQSLMRRPDRDNRRVLALLPIAEARLQPGQADYFRSRVAQAFGYPGLALLAIEQALESSPDTPGFVHQRLELLKTTDLPRAFAEAKQLVAEPKASAAVLAACAGIYAAMARTVEPAALEDIERELLEFTSRFDTAPGHETMPTSTAVMMHITRGFSLLHLNDQEQAMRELSEAIRLDPSFAEAYAARGIETYPSPSAVSDLENAVRLGSASYFPAYYLAHHYIHERDWTAAAAYAEAALLLDPPAAVMANLHEWHAIACFQQGGTLDASCAELAKALELAPENARLRGNLDLLKQLAMPIEAAPWKVERDVRGPRPDAARAA